MVDEGARPAGEADVADVAALAREARRHAVEQRGGPLLVASLTRQEPLEPAFAAILADSDELLLVGTLDGAVVGYAAVRRRVVADGPAVAVIDELFVLPEARGVGVGEELMGGVVAWGEAHGCLGVDAVALPGDRDTKNFFETFGLVARAIVVHRALGPA